MSTDFSKACRFLGLLALSSYTPSEINFGTNNELFAVNKLSELRKLMRVVYSAVHFPLWSVRYNKSWMYYSCH